MLGPFRLLADSVSRMLNNNRDTFEQFQHGTELREEKFEIYENSRKELNKLDDEDRENSRLAALLSGTDASPFEKPVAKESGINALKDSFTPAALLDGLKQFTGFGEPSFGRYRDPANRAEAIENLISDFKKETKEKIKAFPSKVFDKREHEPDTGFPAVVKNVTSESGDEPLPSAVAQPTAAALSQAAIISPFVDAENTASGSDRAVPLPRKDAGLLPILLPGPQETPLGIDAVQEEKSLESPMMDKIPPDQSSLLAKGGVVGAGVVFLARKLGVITDSLEDDAKQNKDEGPGKNAIDFIKKDGLGILKALAPLAVMALGGVAVVNGLQMQKRDTEDSHKYFDEGNTARGVETLILGDRARLTEENASHELGRTAGKSVLLAGGAGLVAAGGAGTAAMIGTAASAGGVAAAGGLGAVGAAGLTAMGAALPPVLIGAAVITAGMVIAKGTHEAFELGRDKNQAAIQKELADTMLSEDSSTIEKIRAGVEGVWKGFTGGLAGGIWEAGKVLDAETMIQNEKQINYIREQAEAGNESHQRLLEMLQSEQFKALSEEERKAAMLAEGLYDEFRGAREATRKTIGEHLISAGKTSGGFFSGLADTTMEGVRGRETAVWEKAAMRGMKNMSGDDAARLQQSDSYKETMANGGDHKKAMESAYLAEAREKAIARGDLREDGMAVQEGNWLAGMFAGGATGGIPGAVAGALGGAVFGKYLGFGDTGMAYKEKRSDEEYRQTFEYSKRKTELMGEGMSAEEADLAAIEEQNALYEQATVLRLKQSADYKKEFDKQLKEGKSIRQAEEAALKTAKENKRNIMSTTELVKDKFREVGETLGNWARNIGGFFKEKFSEAGEGLSNIGDMVKGRGAGRMECRIGMV
jgi:hypothetical protein